MNMAITELYNKYKDEDGFLYLTYASTEMFGWPQMTSKIKVLSSTSFDLNSTSHSILTALFCLNKISFFINLELCLIMKVAR